MKLLLLGPVPDSPPGREPRYRGTDRTRPVYLDPLPKTDELNKLFLWYQEETRKEDGSLDLKTALRYARLLNASDHKSHFEVVEVTQSGEAPTADGAFLGFDLVEGYSASLLRWGLKASTVDRRKPGGAPPQSSPAVERRASAEQPAGATYPQQETSLLRLPRPVRTFYELVSAHFAPTLNTHGLFTSLETASFCHRSMMSVQSFYPDLYESGDLSRFHVVKVFHVLADAKESPAPPRARAATEGSGSKRIP